MNRNMLPIEFIDGKRCWLPKWPPLQVKKNTITEFHNIAKAMQWMFNPVCRCIHCYSNKGFDAIVNITNMNLDLNIIGTLMRAWCRTCGKDQFEPVQPMNLWNILQKETKQNDHD